jgi:7-cyano-7-deazaguanine synthase
MTDNPDTADSQPPMWSRRAVVVLSGGLDSTVALAEYLERGYLIQALSIDYGQRHAQAELRAAYAVAAHYGVRHAVADLSELGPLLGRSALTAHHGTGAVDVPDGHYADESMRATVVPNRNAILASVAVGFAVAARADVVVLGVHAGDHPIYPDCRPEFLTALNTLVKVANDGFAPPVVDAPFLTFDKAAIVARGVALGVPLELTWSCYRGGSVHCGTCGTCVERAEAFTVAGHRDPTRYAAPANTDTLAIDATGEAVCSR